MIDYFIKGRIKQRGKVESLPSSVNVFCTQDSTVSQKVFSPYSRERILFSGSFSGHRVALYPCSPLCRCYIFTTSSTRVEFLLNMNPDKLEGKRVVSFLRYLLSYAAAPSVLGVVFLSQIKRCCLSGTVASFYKKVCEIYCTFYCMLSTFLK